ncbi:uncharacterized protein A1O5_08995 [Cladophialophora psammophila CBS 110553]|uniref:Uncharacterized protein n=1 Tax=Cladophialophora psammophila CBS 110553 TaxID=1182543 RepID=W9XB35_9EURO|nr:uncharacterized protein A1O5_08995 [Cladophialophora psammophila CBS 110553]EXJ67649.1 hypothetical protein A1O5_08995 [Cladophialophora psammophila CBS 110553]
MKWAGVHRAAGDFAEYVGLVTILIGTVMTFDSSFSSQSASPVVIAGTVGKPSPIQALIQAGKIKADAIKECERAIKYRCYQSS